MQGPAAWKFIGHMCRSGSGCPPQSVHHSQSTSQLQDVHHSQSEKQHLVSVSPQVSAHPLVVTLSTSQRPPTGCHSVHKSAPTHWLSLCPQVKRPHVATPSPPVQTCGNTSHQVQTQSPNPNMWQQVCGNIQGDSILSSSSTFSRTTRHSPHLLA